MILDVATGLPVLSEFQSSATAHASPLAAYAAWASAMGLSSSGTAIANMDDDVAVIDLGFPALSGGTESRIFVSSEGGIGLFLTALGDVTKKSGSIPAVSGSGQQSISRFCSTTSTPSLILCGKISHIDGSTFGAKWGAIGGAAILYVNWANWNSAENNSTEAAFRFSPGRIDAVMRAKAGNSWNSYFQVFRTDQSSSALTTSAGDGALTATLPTGTTVRYLSAIPQSSSGSSTTSFGEPSAEQVGTQAARSFASTRFGTPDKTGAQTAFGTPRAQTFRMRWSSYSMPGSWLQAAAHDGAGTIVAVGGANKARVSHDAGITWADAIPSGAYGQWKSVVWTGRMFVAVASDSIMRSDIGDAWTAISVPSSRNGARQVASDGAGRVVITNATGDFGDKYILLSTDFGETFSTVPTTTQIGSTRAKFLNGKFVVAGGEWSSGRGALASSAEGIGWVKAVLPGTQAGLDVAYGNGTYVAIADGGDCFTSPDAETWTQRTIPAGTPGFTGPTGIVFGDGLFLVTAASGAKSISEDGVSWEPATPMMHATETTIWTGKKFLSVGSEYSQHGACIPRASGFATGAFGLARDTRYFAAFGASSTRFGGANAPLHATSIAPARLGTPSAKQHWNAASLGVVTKFPNVFRAVDQWATAGGGQTTRFGGAIAFRYLPTVVPLRTSGFEAPAFGSHAATGKVTCGAAGVRPSTVGTPVMLLAGQASGFSGVAFGDPLIAMAQAATGFAISAFGLPTAARVQTAIGQSPATRMGMPTTDRPDMYPARGFYAMRGMGRATGFIRFNHPATGFTSTALGQPTCHEAHRAAHQPPGGQFGRPLLKRASTC